MTGVQTCALPICGARVQLGADLQLTLNALDLMPAEAQARGGMKQRLDALRERLTPIVNRLPAQANRVASVNWIVEGISEGVYMPDRGFSGLPLYMLGDARKYLASAYAEPALGDGGDFASLIKALDDGKVLGSVSVARFYKRAIDQPMPIGRNTQQQMDRAPRS